MALISKNVYIDKLEGIVNKYYNTYSTIKMKPVDVKSKTCIDSSQEINMIKIWNLKLVVMLKHQNMKIFLLKVTLQIGQKKILWLKKLKIVCRESMLLVILTGKKLLECFTKTNCKNKSKRI